MNKLIFSTLAISLVFLGCAQKPEERQIQKKDKELTIQLEGTSYPYKSQTITSINGKVKEIKNPTGSYVKKDDVIFSIDEKIIQKQIEQLQFEIENSEKNLRGYRNAYSGGTNPTIIHLARMNLEKVARLYAQGYTSEERFNEAKNNYANVLFNNKTQQNNNSREYYAQEQDLASKKTELAVLQERLKDTTVKSKIEGFILNLDLYEDQQIGEGQKVGTIVDISRIKIKAGLATGLLPYVKEGEKVTITFLTTPPYNVSVPIGRVVPVLDPEFGRIAVEFEVANKDYIVQAGTKAIVSIPLQEQDQEQVRKIFIKNEKQTTLDVQSSN